AVSNRYFWILREVKAWAVECIGVQQRLVERDKGVWSAVEDDLRLAVLVNDLRTLERAERLVPYGGFVHGAAGRVLDDPRGDPVVADLLPQRDAMVAVQDVVRAIRPLPHDHGRRVRGGGPELLFDRVGLHVPGRHRAGEVFDVLLVVVAADR